MSWMHLRGLGNLCSSAVYNQGRLKIELIRQAHNRLPDKANENVANQRKQILQTMTSWKTSYGPSSENCPGPPYPLIRLWSSRTQLLNRDPLFSFRRIRLWCHVLSRRRVIWNLWKSATWQIILIQIQVVRSCEPFTLCMLLTTVLVLYCLPPPAIQIWPRFRLAPHAFGNHCHLKRRKYFVRSNTGVKVSVFFILTR